MEGRFELRGMFNIAMEAFEEFCRAKTNFYVFEKVGNVPEGMVQEELVEGNEA
jgi:type I restriction enzyme M protein